MAKKESKPRVHEDLEGLSFEVDEFGEITFVMNGKVGIGFEVNGRKMIAL